jgi:hypothetical protein
MLFSTGYYAASNNRITDERLLGKNLEGSGRGLIKICDRDLHAGREDNHEEPESG